MATLVDTSVWIKHLKVPNSTLIGLLEAGEVLIHSAIVGELAAGSIKNRNKFLGNLKLIPKITEVQSDEVLDFIEARKLHGKGLSWIDLQLVASALVAKCDLLTFDVTLDRAFRNLS